MLAIRVMLFVAMAALVIGLLVSLVYFILGSLYIIPYSCWLGIRLSEGQYGHLEHTSLKTSFRCATRLYRHWLLGKELDL